jgi:hypothetical protein
MLPKHLDEKVAVILGLSKKDHINLIIIGIN